jgi:four helix bundle protein
LEAEARERAQLRTFSINHRNFAPETARGVGTLQAKEIRMDAPTIRSGNDRESHKSLPVWKRSIELACKVYAATRSLPSDERFTLDQQLRRSALAIASNIAEGWARGTRTEFLLHLRNARGALLEVDIQTMVAIGQGYVEATSDLPDDILELGRQLNNLMRNTNAAAQAAHAKACRPPDSVKVRDQSRPSTSSAS